jgi:hypothetical protein
LKNPSQEIWNDFNVFSIITKSMPWKLNLPVKFYAVEKPFY